MLLWDLRKQLRLAGIKFYFIWLSPNTISDVAQSPWKLGGVQCFWFSENTYLSNAGLFVIVSWISFLIPMDVIPGRMALLVTLFLVLVNIFNTVTTNTPKVKQIHIKLTICHICFKGGGADCDRGMDACLYPLCLWCPDRVSYCLSSSPEICLNSIPKYYKNLSRRLHYQFWTIITLYHYL